MAMVKKLSPIGNSLGLLIDKPILEMLNITADTQLEVTTDGVNLMIRPLRTGHAGRVQAATRAVMKAHDKTLRKLAE
jgi:antitoxin component of MazEF toxin-antitoxin module